MTSRSVLTVTESVEQSEGEGTVIKRCLGEDVVNNYYYNYISEVKEGILKNFIVDLYMYFEEKKLICITLP